MEEYAYVLDYWAQGLPASGFAKREPLCYAVGEEEFKLFEIVPKANISMSPGDRVYIGKDASQRTHVDHIKKRVSFNELTNAAKAELEYTISNIVMNDQERFIGFYNTADAISLLGKKTLLAILDERKKGKFKDFAEFAARVPLLKGPEKLITRRIIQELSDLTLKHYIFVR
jgi:putative nucleotide binding protein